MVILSFATSPYQNNSVHEENYGKQTHQQNQQQHQQPHRRPMFIDDDDELAHTHLIEKFHSGTFDENDYFDTHEKLENERTTLLMTTAPPVTAPSNSNNNNNIHGMYNDTNKGAMPTTPSIFTNTESNEKQQLYVENPGAHPHANNNNNRRQQTRMRNRNNGMAGGRGSNRKNSNRERFNDNAATATSAAAGQSNRREKYNRRTDDLREHFETKVNNNNNNNDLEFEKGGGGGGGSGEFGEKGAANTKSQRKYVTKIDTSPDELPPDNEFELNTSNRKSSTVRDSNIHKIQYKSAEAGTFVPSTPYSTDSKIIEIKPSTVRSSKRVKRSDIRTRIQIDSDGTEDEFGELVDEADVEPRIFVNFENDEQYVENDESSLKPAAAAAALAPDAIAAALIDNTAVPANVTPMITPTTTTTSKQLHGFVGCLQHYLKVDKEIGKREFANAYM